MNRSKKSISEEIVALSQVDRRLSRAFGVVILALMLTVLVAGGLYIDDVMKRQDNRLSTTLTRVLADSVSRVSFSGKYHAQLLLDDIIGEQPDIAYLLITDNDGRVLASSDRSRLDTRLRGDALRQVRAVLGDGESGQTRRIEIDGRSILEVTLPYHGGFDHSVQGVVQVGLSRESQAIAWRQGILLMTVIVLGLLFAGMVAVRRLSQRFGSPVRKLAGDMAATLQAMPDLLLELDREGRYLQVLSEKEELLPDNRERLLGRTVDEMLPAEAAVIVGEALAQADSSGESHGLRFSLPLPLGLRWFELSVARKDGGSGIRSRFIVLARDVSDRVEAEKELHLYANVFRHSGEAIMITDAFNRIVSINPALTHYTGYTLEELRGKNPSILASGHTTRDVYRDMWTALDASGYWQGELWDRRKDGESFPKWVSISAIRSDQGEVVNYIASYTDITERKQAEARIDYIAHHDALTGLFNRFSLEERLQQALLSAQREQTLLAVLFLDMDRFKDINDSLGHHTGDALLTEVGRRLKGKMRDSDIVARLGGDEFVVVLPGIESNVAVAAVATALIELLGRPYTIEGRVLHSTPSIGISMFPEDGGDAAELMKNADVAMYHAKDKGRNNFQFFTAAMNQVIAERLGLENDLRLAVAENQFVLHYQPICNPRSGACGVEALIRWRHPQKGMIPPAEFIPLAEESRIILPLGLWVIEEACRQGARWHADGLSDITVSVNLSVHQLYDPEFPEQVRDIIARNGVPAETIEFEVTESTAMRHPEQAIEQLRALRALGISLAIDDFGTGYSSLAYLKRLPIDTLKLDRAFVDDIESDENDRVISAATVALAHTLGLKVVAEGVETEAQRDFLIAHRCDYLQGYLFSRPLPADEVPHVVRSIVRAGAAGENQTPATL